MPFKFENWLLTENGLEHSDKPDFFIEKNSLITKRNENTYDWMSHVAEKTGVFNKLDVFCFNLAFLFAINYFKLDLDLNAFHKSILEQNIILNEDFDNNLDELSIG